MITEYMFDNLYYITDDHGMLELCFYNESKKEGLIFENCTFYVGTIEMNERIDSFSLYKLNTHSPKIKILGLRETEDFDIFIKLEKNILIHILFFPDNAYPNGVSQIFRVYSPESSSYMSVLEDFNEGEPIEIKEMRLRKQVDPGQAQS